MKYVVLKHPQTGATSIVFGLMISHAEIAAHYLAAGYIPQSAGHVRFLERGLFETLGRSDSLALEPHPDDARLIAAMYASNLKSAA